MFLTLVRQTFHERHGRVDYFTYDAKFKDLDLDVDFAILASGKVVVEGISFSQNGWNYSYSNDLELKRHRVLKTPDVEGTMVRWVSCSEEEKARILGMREPIINAVLSCRKDSESV